MFVRADRLLAGARSPFRPKHIISFYWDEFVPHLEVFDHAECKVMEQPLSWIEMSVSERKKCVGRFDDDGYHPCPAGAIVGTFDQCPACASPWIPIQECIFEPRCNGDMCDCDFCRKKHLVYAVFAGDAVKIGLTGSSRLRTRGIEQGADAIAPLIVCEGRLEARRMEREISRVLRLTQQTSSAAISRRFLPSPPRSRIEISHRRILTELERRRYAVVDEIHHLDAYPIVRRLDSPLRPLPTAGEHSGNVLGMKGGHMLYEDARTGEPRVLEVADLPGRFIEPPRERDNRGQEDAL
ncbi:MAG: DUF2797 domain-containing protein [Euryarchaeota archaeon]|nr:DUF2797 domain-containing protein [Euryarchaeota archaeon]